MKKFLFLLFLIQSFAVSAENIIWDGEANSIDIASRIDILEDRKGDLDINRVSDSDMAGRFIRSRQQVLHFDFSGSAYWLRFSLQQEANDNLLLVLGQAVLPAADLYFKNKYGHWECIKAGYKVNMNEKILRHHYQIYPMPKGNKEYYLRLISFSPPVPVFIWKADAYKIRADNQKMYYGLYVGILFFVILYNTFLSVSLRNFTYFHYALVVLLYLLISACVMDGYILYFFPNANLTFLYAFLPSLSMVVSSFYAVRFLEIKKYAPGIYKYSIGVVLYFASSMLFHVLLPQPIVLMLNQLNALFSLVFMFWLGLKVRRNRNKLGYYFALAYFIYLIIVVFEIIYIQTGIPRYLFGLSHVSIAIMIEAIVLAYLLSKRFYWEKEEIQLAKEETQMLLLSKTQETEQMVRDQNVRLEQTVQDRTLEILQQKEIVEKTLAEKEVLLKEIHHRVKNNLQTISSMLMLQSAGLKDEQAKKAIAETQHRVSSIALVHQKLYQNDGLEKVELSAFVKDLTEQVKSFYRGPSKDVSIQLIIPETSVPIDIAVPLGLLLNELLTNSFKHAFSESSKGSISIELIKLNPEPDKNSKPLKLVYSDSGQGLESQEVIDKSTTMGLRLIKLLSQQIGATLVYSNIDGSQFIFSFNGKL